MSFFGMERIEPWDRDGWRLDVGRRRVYSFWLSYILLLVIVMLLAMALAALMGVRTVALAEAIGVLTVLLLVVVALRRRLGTALPRGSLSKRFELRPTTLSSIVETVTVDLGEALSPEECKDSRRDLNRGKDCHRAYSLRGRGTSIMITREFRWTREMRVSSVLRIGPVGEGEDDLVARLRTVIDDADRPTSESLEVDFSNVQPEYVRRKRSFFACTLLMFPSMLAFMVVNLVFRTGDGPSSRQILLLWFLTAALAGAVLLMGYWAMARLYDLAREVDIG